MYMHIYSYESNYPDYFYLNFLSLLGLGKFF